MDFAKLKNCIKRNKALFYLYEMLFQRTIFNLYKTNYINTILFSYSTYHFNKKNYVAHSNYQESHVIANTFKVLGFNVDVCNNNKLFNGDLSKYYMVFGEGIPLYQACVLKENQIKTVYYGTGSHPFQCSGASLLRAASFKKNRNFFSIDSLRVVDQRWGIAASLADSVVAIANDFNANTYINYGASSITCINPTYISNLRCIKSKSNIRNPNGRIGLLWIGSYGLLHKGLDIAVELIRNDCRFELHVAGYTDRETNFLDSLNLPNNVYIHGFLDVNSIEFEQMVGNCSFSILPSCSEGIATSLVTAGAYAGLPAIASFQCGLDSSDFVFNANYDDFDGFKSLLNFIVTIDDQEYSEISSKCARYYKSTFSLNNYTSRIHNVIESIVNA